MSKCQLTTKDFAIVKTMLDRLAWSGGPLVALLRRKLASAHVVFSNEADADVVTLNSRVTFSVDGGAPHTRIVAHGPMDGMVGQIIPITVPRGLALLGLRKGQSILVDCGRGETETIRVDEIHYQPESARPGVTTPEVRANPGERRFPVLVFSADEPQPLGAPRKIRHTTSNGDDPGPTAA
ncbi:GreA/GreB family elongation factor [Aminobacter carboxidus]|uniref:GreA/GreB family elongation factor n=1 Tax=Aminobacter carboxidus TaxID=376165 RepID=A0A8E1WCK3_9HYPH|nr:MULTISPECIES: GreA/GreB family elongation factor [Aminobacter carboxidus group]MBB6465494.1 regulator of nucleoside diphosphate kinase [Aminobacter lissarensis]MBE1204698.1 GreA/GreB family elongation factor [Aminobacter carboxidus]